MTDQQALERFREFCQREAGESDPDKKFDPSEEQDWKSLSIGFFAALGLSAERAISLAAEARYKHEYWTH